MQKKELTAGLSVSGQIMPVDIKAIKHAGFRAIICSRPDGEGADQPTFEEIAKTGKDAGLEVAYLPVVSGKVMDEDANAFDNILTQLPGPVLAYCRSGTRSATLWSVSPS